MTKESQQLGRNLRRIRTEKGLSQGDVAKPLSVGRGYISNVEHGKTNPTLATIVKLAKVLGIKAKDLLE